jgi:putative transcriptional regulator
MKNELRALRERHSLTQARLADLLGVSRQTVNALETGRYDPSLPLAFRIAALFGQPIESIFHPEQDSTTGLQELDRLP